MQYGYFDNEKREYVIDNVALPCSWTNYLGVEDMAAVINHTAGGYLFYKTPEYHRISRFRGNGVPMDRPGFYVYIRDNEKKDYYILWIMSSGRADSVSRETGSQKWTSVMGHRKRIVPSKPMRTATGSPVSALRP